MTTKKLFCLDITYSPIVMVSLTYCSPRAYLCVCYWQVTCYDKDEDTSSDMIGEFTCTTRQLLDAKDRAVSQREPLCPFVSLKLPLSCTPSPGPLL